jgi:hypothetical protein
MSVNRPDPPANPNPHYLCVYCESLFDIPVDLWVHSLAEHAAEWTDLAELAEEIADQGREYTWAEEIDRRGAILHAIRLHYGHIPDASVVLADWPR